MAGGNFMHRVISYFVNEVVVNGLANRCFFIFEILVFLFMHVIFEVVRFLLWFFPWRGRGVEERLRASNFLDVSGVWEVCSFIMLVLLAFCWFFETSIESRVCMIWFGVSFFDLFFVFLHLEHHIGGQIKMWKTKSCKSQVIHISHINLKNWKHFLITEELSIRIVNYMLALLCRSLWPLKVHIFAPIFWILQPFFLV